MMGNGLQTQIAGVGLFFVQGANKGACVVDEVIPGSAAHGHGGIEVGDTLVSVDGNGVQGKDLSEVRNMIVGPLGTQVTLGLFSASENGKYKVTLSRGVTRNTPTPPAGNGTANGKWSANPKGESPSPR
jgi:C-terminal processing protease CtpA/Prc